ncbi:glycosyltransferase [Myxococcota bacterium]|nr:glycosyltransferase [Myxococcota bacterium]
MTKHTREIQEYLQKRRAVPPQIAAPPAKELGLCVVIPAHDEPDIEGVLASLWACDPPTVGVEVIVVVNAPEGASLDVCERNRAVCEQAARWQVQPPHHALTLHLIEQTQLPRKHAGVGLARKIGMDEAAARLASVGRAHGIIACLDADCTVAPNYLQALKRGFAQDSTHAAAIHFEHPIPPDARFWTDLSREQRAICLYELFLRYYIHAQRWADLPFAYQTVGSSMAVRALAYARQGGMNKRQAGEDFYFLQKLIRYGGVVDITETTVFPSARCSHRVPFGTGRAMQAILQHEIPRYETYPLEVFALLRDWLPQVWTLWDADALAWKHHLDQIPEPLRGFLDKQRFLDKIQEIRSNAPSLGTFRKRFWDWWDAFQLMKWAHEARETLYPLQPVEHACVRLFSAHGIHLSPEESDPLALLHRMRVIDRRHEELISHRAPR